MMIWSTELVSEISGEKAEQKMYVINVSDKKWSKSLSKSLVEQIFFFELSVQKSWQNINRTFFSFQDNLTRLLIFRTDGKLRNSFCGAVIFISLLHFISPSLNLMLCLSVCLVIFACLPSRRRREAMFYV